MLRARHKPSQQERRHRPDRPTDDPREGTNGRRGLVGPSINLRGWTRSPDGDEARLSMALGEPHDRQSADSCVHWVSMVPERWADQRTDDRADVGEATVAGAENHDERRR